MRDALRIPVPEFGGRPSFPYDPNSFGLRSLTLPTDLLFDFPVGEQVLMTATGTQPRTLDRVGAALVEHLHDKVAMKTHCGMAINAFFLCRLSANRHVRPPYQVTALPRHRRLPCSQTDNI
jgi:hypothetical protein